METGIAGPEAGTGVGVAALGPLGAGMAVLGPLGWGAVVGETAADAPLITAAIPPDDGSEAWGAAASIRGWLGCEAMGPAGSAACKRAAERPESVSRLSRFRSVRRSAAL